jgi:hypothetical protein
VLKISVLIPHRPSFFRTTQETARTHGDMISPLVSYRVELKSMVAHTSLETVISALRSSEWSYPSASMVSRIRR